MKVYGYEPTEKQINEAIKYMQSSLAFRSRNIEKILISEGVPEKQSRLYSYVFVAHRVADRLLQKLRKEGKIKLVARATWQWVDENEKEE